MLFRSVLPLTTGCEMKTFINRLVIVLYVLANLTMHVVDGTVQIRCPDESYLNEPTTLTCSTSQAFSNIIYKAPAGNAPQCSQTGCTDISGFQAVPINSTSTQLTILRVQERHAGQWGCANGNQRFNYSSLVVAEKSLSCSIISDKSPALRKKISLTVDIQDYYCSAALNVSLRVGYVRETLSAAVTGPKRITAIKEINMTTEHFGDLGLEFCCTTCRIVTCGGVKHFDVPLPECPLPPDNTKLIVCAIVVLVAFDILLVVVVLTKEELRGFMRRMCQKPDAKEKTKQPHLRVPPAVKS